MACSQTRFNSSELIRQTELQFPATPQAEKSRRFKKSRWSQTLSLELPLKSERCSRDLERSAAAKVTRALRALRSKGIGGVQRVRFDLEFAAVHVALKVACFPKRSLEERRATLKGTKRISACWNEFRLRKFVDFSSTK